MAPMLEDTIDDRLKAVIQDLYEIQSSVHGYLGPETKQVLINKITDLTTSLSTLAAQSSALHTHIPPEIIAYIEEGRNPDIYTREFVELVQRLNSYLKGKGEAFAGLRDALAEEIVRAWPEMRGEVEEAVGGGEGVVERREG